MNMQNPLRSWLIKRVLKSALVFERDMFEAYEAILKELQKKPAGERFRKLLEEEKHHQQILTRLTGRRIDDEELEKIFGAAHFHDPASTLPLPPNILKAVGQKIAELQNIEKESYLFYSNLQRISKIPAVKKAFKFLADQERQHLLILEKLASGTNG